MESVLLRVVGGRLEQCCNGRFHAWQLGNLMIGRRHWTGSRWTMTLDPTKSAANKGWSIKSPVVKTIVPNFPSPLTFVPATNSIKSDKRNYCTGCDVRQGLAISKKVLNVIFIFRDPENPENTPFLSKIQPSPTNASKAQHFIIYVDTYYSVE